MLGQQEDAEGGEKVEEAGTIVPGNRAAKPTPDTAAGGADVSDGDGISAVSWRPGQVHEIRGGAREVQVRQPLVHMTLPLN